MRRFWQEICAGAQGGCRVCAALRVMEGKRELREHCHMAKWGLQISAAASLLWAVSACTQDSTPVAAQALQEELTSAGTISVACKLFSRDQIAKAVGASVDAGVTSGPLGTGCSWAIRGQDRSVMVQIVPRDYWEDGTRQPGGEALTGIGEKAFVGPWLDDQRAGALTANGAVYVMSPKKETSVVLLRDAATRVPPQ
jgi:hypothetical protein